MKNRLKQLIPAAIFLLVWGGFIIFSNLDQNHVIKINDENITINIDKTNWEYINRDRGSYNFFKTYKFQKKSKREYEVFPQKIIIHRAPKNRINELDDRLKKIHDTASAEKISENEYIYSKINSKWLTINLRTNMGRYGVESQQVFKLPNSATNIKEIKYEELPNYIPNIYQKIDQTRKQIQQVNF